MNHFSGFAVFMHVAETRSLVAAGRLLGISASAVGKSLARLEGKLGVRLFHRSTRSITLTNEGALFLERCRRIAAEIEAAELELSQSMATPRGRLRISLPPLVSLLRPVFSTFQHAYPDIELELDFTDRMVDIVEEGFDAVIRAGKLASSRLAARQLGTFRMLLVAAPHYLKRRGTPQLPEDLLEHKLLHYRYSNTGKLELWPLRYRPGKPELQLPISMVCNDVDARLFFTLQGLGIACLPDFMVHQSLARGDLREVLTDHVDSAEVLYMLWPASRLSSPKLRALIDYFGANLFPAVQPSPAPTPRRRTKS